MLQNVPADRETTLQRADADNTVTPSEVDQELLFTEGKTLFQEISDERNIQFKHQEQDKIDFNLQRTLPHKYTQYGPGIATGDINGDGLDDFFIGGSANQIGTFFIQSQDGTFTPDTIRIKSASKKEEDMGTLLFDADGDGDLDLFVGVRVLPGQYPLPPQNYILRNEGGKFTNVTEEVCPTLSSLGMVTDALWSDFDNDGHIDLVIAGEWLPISFFRNTQGTFENVTEATGIANHVGWWNSLASGDFDNDGDIDYIAGNLGLNTRYKADEDHPLQVYTKDFDGNGSIDPILVSYVKDEKGEFQPFPMHSRDDMVSQMVRIKQQFLKYEQYGLATIHEVLSEEDMKGALVYQATHLASSYLENQGNGSST